MKICKKCGKLRPYSQYDTRHLVCNKCRYKARLVQDRTRIGLCKAIYKSQVNNSKQRGHQPPTYSQKEFIERMLSIPVFEPLYTAWKNSGYLKNLRPSPDRLDDSKGYSFNNLRLITWGENAAAAHKIYPSLGGCPSKPVKQYSKQGDYIATHVSTLAAAKAVGKPKGLSNIARVCKGKQKIAYGFQWEYI